MGSPELSDSYNVGSFIWQTSTSTSVYGPFLPSLQTPVAAIIYHESNTSPRRRTSLPSTATHSYQPQQPYPSHTWYTWVICPASVFSALVLSPTPTCTPNFIFTPSPHPGDDFFSVRSIFFHLFHEYSVKRLKH